MKAVLFERMLVVAMVAVERLARVEPIQFHVKSISKPDSNNHLPE